MAREGTVWWGTHTALWPLQKLVSVASGTAFHGARVGSSRSAVSGTTFHGAGVGLPDCRRWAGQVAGRPRG